MDLELTGKTAIVGGASSGLGLATAEALANEGAHVVMVGRRPDLLKFHADRIGAHAYVADLRVHDELARLVDHTVNSYGGLDILVWNTGGPAAGSAVYIRPDDVRSTFEALFIPIVELVQLALPHLRNSRQGRIIAITTGGVKEPTGIALSNAIRPGIVGYLKTLSTELAAEGITVNNLAPGRIHTERFDQVYPDGPPLDLASDIPMKRFGLPSDIGSAASFLASARANYITGITLNIDGGLARSIF
ncbi:MAG: SDR family oxidoreductase [Rhodococcus sp. (in: high G+C Gram-positive bacteria)]